MKMKGVTISTERLESVDPDSELKLDGVLSSFDMVWAFGVPLKYRPQIERQLPGRVSFITITTTLAERKARLLAPKSSCFLLWDGAKAPDHDEFVKQHRFTVFGVAAPSKAAVTQSSPLGAVSKGRKPPAPAIIPSPTGLPAPINEPPAAIDGFEALDIVPGYVPKDKVTVFDNRLFPGELTCILPYRYTPERDDFEERIRNPLLDLEIPRAVSFLMVDDGSIPEMAARNREICRSLGYSYLYIDTAEKEFSVGRCRNVGAQYAQSEFIFMQDIDLMPYKGFYNQLLGEIKIQGMSENGKHFLMVPYIFLSKEGTEAYNNTPADLRRQQFIHHAITSNQAMVEKISVGTSANVYNRLWYLGRGGNSPDFEGWGYEDLEFNTRAIRHLQLFPIPREWSLEKFNFNSVVEWRSYKAVYRLFGDLLMFKGIALFHAWHDVSEDTSYMEKRNINREIFIKKIADFPRSGQEPEPLPAMDRGATLLFRKNAFTQGRVVRPLLGRIFHLQDEKKIDSADMLKEVVKHFGITRIVFFNPYQTEHMLKLYFWAREGHIPYYVAERGALPGSNFFDPNGFLMDSSSYHPEKWDYPLTKAEADAVVNYIDSIRLNRPALEDQPPAIGGQELRKKLGVPAGQKLVLISLQRPGDTVTRFFHRNLSYEQFLEQVKDACAKGMPNVTFCVKKHPLETESLPGKNYINVDDQNIYDLLEACDAVWTFNSGVGVLAMAYEKPVMVSGAAFYSFEGVNHKVDTLENVRSVLSGPLSFDGEKGKRFIHYLRNKLYSFGDHQTRKVKMPDGSNMTATLEIHYSDLNFDGLSWKFNNRKKAVCGWDAVLFDRYRASEKALKA